jgi:hypothetical protein
MPPAVLDPPVATSTATAAAPAAASAGDTPNADTAFDAAFPDLDELNAPAAAPVPSPAPVPGASPSLAPRTAGKPAAAAALPAGTEPSVADKATADAAAAAAATGAAKSAEDGIPQFSTPKALRKYAEEQSSKAKSLEAKLSAASQRLEQLEKMPFDTGKAQADIKERMAALEQQLTEKEEELKLVNYKRSTEYREQFEKPFTEAAQRAYAIVKQLSVIESTDGDGNAVERPATEQDFVEVYNLPFGKARRLAEKMFGSPVDAATVMQHWTQVHEMSEKADRAIATHKTAAADHEKAQAAHQSVEREGIDRMWRLNNEGLAKKYPKWFGEDPEDAEGNRLLKDGFALVDSRWSQDSALTPQQKVTLDARIRNQAAAFPRMAYLMKKQATEKDARIAALEKELNQFQASQPGKVQRPAGTPGAVTEDNWEKAFDALAD